MLLSSPCAITLASTLGRYVSSLQMRVADGILDQPVSQVNTPLSAIPFLNSERRGYIPKTEQRETATTTQEKGAIVGAALQGLLTAFYLVRLGHD